MAATDGDTEQALNLQALIQTFVASSALDLNMSLKEFWSKYGAQILGEPNVKRDAKGNLTEVNGKSVRSRIQTAFNQSWVKLWWA